MIDAVGVRVEFPPPSLKWDDRVAEYVMGKGERGVRGLHWSH